MSSRTPADAVENAARGGLPVDAAGVPGPPTSGRGRRVVVSAVRSFALRSLVLTLVLGAVSVVLAGRVAEREALRDARSQASGIAIGVASLIDEDLRAGDTAARRRVDRFFRSRIVDGSLRHIKIWAADGTVIWADQFSLIGRRFPLEEDVRDLLGTHGAVAQVSEPDRAENVGEVGEGPALEVYVGSHDLTGRPMVFEAYLSTEGMEENRKAILRSQLPLLVGGLAALLVTLMPLAVALARRVDREEQRRSRLTRHALLASDLERRRMVQDLHDGVIQDLAGVTYVLPTINAGLPRGEEGREVRAVFARVQTVLTGAVAALRVMLTDTYPPDLEHGGLAVALDELADHVRHDRRAGDGAGAVVELAVDDGPETDPIGGTTARLVYRVVREALRNVVSHAHAKHVSVDVRRAGTDVVVTVADDGVGMDPGARPPGRWGLQLLADTLADLDGDLELSRTPGGGLTVTARIPGEATL